MKIRYLGRGRSCEDKERKMVEEWKARKREREREREREGGGGGGGGGEKLTS